MAHLLSFGPSPPRQTHGAHLASGSYRAKVASLFSKNPNLRYPDLDLLSDGGGTGKVAMLQFFNDRMPARTDFSDPEKLECYLSQDTVEPAETCLRRLFIIEGYDPDLIGVFGEHFQINPGLLVRQQRTATWESYHRSGNTPCLPSLLNPSQSFCIPYYELHHFPQGLPDSLGWRSADGCRQISLSRMPGTFDRVGIVDRKASYWSRITEIGGWDAILLVDPPIREVFEGSLERISLPSEPYQGGYLDFVDHSNLKEACRTSGPLRESMLEDICFYWTNYATYIDVQDEPAISTIFLKKIVASNYLLLIEYIRGMLSNQEWSLSRQHQDISEIQIAWAEQRWSDLQSWSRRCSEYCDNLESILDGLGIPFPENQDANIDKDCPSSPNNNNPEWTRSEKDFPLIRRKLVGLKRRSDTLISSLAGLVSILSSRQALKEATRSLQEAKSVKVLTLLGMMFAPLFFTSGLLSMSADYLPGAPGFWVYIVVAVPLVGIVFVVVFLVNLGYDGNGDWSVKQWRRSVVVVKRRFRVFVGG